ncbi:hypothetical protein K469DRAFT_706204 [Zopfia rhizophila CBS 207.26]|uniref:MADS-box domain-containing protein n=1 Tax=Zopfia rhizophila CBS 207.26 TaxID=1314779 RepID=A0A6A6EU50_9PEZI|nr:hypothetical protein K469DRAFT_706204 [Zopfia rhizophila CBS 207.26]
MSSKPQISPKRAANESFRKRIKTLGNKFSDLWLGHEADIYFVAHRNGRFYIFTSTDEPSWPPSPETLMKLYPLPIKKSLAQVHRIKRGRAKVNARKAISHEHASAGCGLTSAQADSST